MQSLKGIEGLWTLVTLSALLITIIFCANASAAAAKNGNEWCYKDATCAPNQWKDICKNGKYQSPIDIKNPLIKEKQIRLRFNKQYMDAQNPFLIRNNGHTVQVQLNEDLSSNLMMDSDGLNGKYIFSQLHFHWGSHDDVGSEHILNGISYPAELHLVHYSSVYKGLGDAVAQKNPRALAVLGLLFEISDQDNTALKPIIDALKQVPNMAATPVSIPASLNMSAFFPSDLSLYRYYGSLTTPTCNEVVHWNVFRTKIPISRTQLEGLRSLKDSHESVLVDNYRPPMPLSNRKLFLFDKVVMEPMPESGAKDESKPEPDATDDFIEILNGGKQESTTGKQESTTKSSATNRKLQSTSLSFVATLITIVIPIAMRFHQ